MQAMSVVEKLHRPGRTLLDQRAHVLAANIGHVAVVETLI